ncbi:low affinity iron permease family protein [Cupriavidus plantarum]|uniref:Low affinity Fe/Cu permease n=1 Tax=Cupriavidus plantarum TaxID=942865 RepID=A0A316FDM2_9BURK|nr:low affinity iron permease family protein [Cupriavidus plantarum]PWK35450.1 low affinity Fe/Cu permease [Cupriavidus plantarum]RLK39315.1 low affinity Fe/Cu permease [Cupriavidus plantarum]
MESSKNRRMMHLFDRFAGAATRQAGSPAAFALAVAVVLIWAISGPLFGFSETWQLVINTGTTIITFLMVFLIQQSQNKDSTAVHLKLNELLASHKEASNHLISIEDLDEEELRQLVRFYRHLAELADQEGGVKCSHSLDEAQEIHEDKSRALHERLRRTRTQRGHETAQG